MIRGLASGAIMGEATLFLFPGVVTIIQGRRARAILQDSYIASYRRKHSGNLDPFMNKMSSYYMAVSCFLLITVLVYIQPLCSAVAPDDRHDICRTDFRYRLAHDWIPYANDTSSGTWKVLIDQYDYQNLLGTGIPPGVWTGQNIDGDGRQVSQLGIEEMQI